MARNTPRVLGVDDDLPNCDALEVAFADEGRDVRVRTGGQDAPDRLQRWTADMILPDLRTFGIEVEAFLTRCRGQEPKERATPVLVLTQGTSLGKLHEPTRPQGAIPENVAWWCTSPTVTVHGPAGAGV